MSLGSNEYYIRKMSNQLSIMLGLPYNVVRSVLDGEHLCVLNSIKEQGRIDLLEKGEINKISIEIPNIGTLKLTPAKYPKTENSILDGNAFRPKFIIKEQFLLQCRYAYYDQKNYLVDELESNFKDLFSEYYSSIVSKELQGYDELNLSDQEIKHLKSLELKYKKLSPSDRLMKIRTRIEEMVTGMSRYYNYLDNFRSDLDIQALVATDEEIKNSVLDSKIAICGRGVKTKRLYLMKREEEYINLAKNEGDTLYFKEDNNNG